METLPRQATKHVEFNNVGRCCISGNVQSVWQGPDLRIRGNLVVSASDFKFELLLVSAVRRSLIFN